MKRVRKNSDINFSKRQKLDNSTNNEHERNDTSAMKSQCESFVRNTMSSMECSDYNNSDVNTSDKSQQSMNPILKTFGKSETLDSDAAEFKEVYQKIVQSEENDEQQNQRSSDMTSSNSNITISTTSMQMQENSENSQNSNILNKNEKEPMETLSNFKLLHRENDILIDFETNTIESVHNQDVTDANSICLPSEHELFLTDSNIKELSNNSLNSKPNDETNAAKQVSNIQNLNNVPQDNTSNANQKKIDETAKVSIGNTTISVPLLKPLNFRRIVTNDAKTQPNIVRKVINIRGGNKMKAPTIVQLSQVHLNPKMNTKIVQATLVGNKIQLPNMSIKPSPNYVKSNFLQSPMEVSTLPKQIFEDEMVFLENTSQSQNPTEEDSQSKSISNPVMSTVNKQFLPKTSDANSKPGNFEDQVVTKSSPSYLTQCRVIESDSNTQAKTFETVATDTVPISIAVSTGSDNVLSRVTSCLPKTSRKPLIMAKTVPTTEGNGGPTVGKEANTEINRPPTASGSEQNQSKDNQQISDSKVIGKMLEDNVLLRKQIALAVQNNRFQLKVSKYAEENKAKKSEKNGESVTISAPKQRPITKPVTAPGQNLNNEQMLVTNVEKIEKPNIPKSDETQNVLLKHLLQSSITQRSNTGCNQSLAPRKLATVRAPSLGVVSSLEAQLARPVIPPVSAVNDIKPEMKFNNKIQNDKNKKNPIESNHLTMRTRPEMISRETSFVSTFTPNQKNTNVSTEMEKNHSMQVINQNSTSQNINNNQASQQEPPRTQQYQPNQNSNNFNSVNLFKFFKQQEQTNSNNSPNIEINTNKIQNKVQSPEENSDNKTSIKSETDEAGSSPTIKSKPVKMDIEQNIELRKRFKRDYQKHKRQMLLNKDSPNHQKKKSRKLSKATEDFDEFIENKVVQMKQMFVLEVLEPLLSTFLGICSIYGYNEKIKNQYPYISSTKDDFGRTNLKNYVDFYATKPYGPNQSDKTKNTPSFQNKFYDEEFSTINQKPCDKLFQFINNLKHQHFQTIENFSIVSRSPSNEMKNQSLLSGSYCGSKFQNFANTNEDRMSPVISIIDPNQFGIIKRCKPTNSDRKKCAYGNVETTVILTLSSFVAENILDILRDLENLLNVYSPLSNNIYNNDKMSVNNVKSLYISRMKVLQKHESTNIQNVLNGTYKCCRNCHLTIICGIVGGETNLNIKSKILADNHSCDKFCSTQYKKKGKKYILSKKKENNIYANNSNKTNKETTTSTSTTTNSVRVVENNNFCNMANYKVFSPNCFWKPSYKPSANDDSNDVSMKMRIAITLNNSKDTRRCVLCNQKGDSFPEGASRLLNYDVNKWVHLNCALWSNSVYETINGGLMNLELTMQQGLHQLCSYCNQYGASIKCFKMRCTHTYHLPCAIKEQCVFYKNKTIHCASHAHRMEKKNELSSIRVRRRVYIERDENRQVAAVMHHLELSNLLRIGNLTFINVGQLLPHQLEAFHSRNYIYPIGYKIVRFFWSTKKLNKRCRYICSIVETNGRPEFVIQIQEQFESEVEIRDISPKAVWQRVLEKIVLLRKGQAIVQLFTEFITGEDMFGLSEPSIVRILESLPGVESLTDYRFKYGRNPLLELPLALNPSGAARTEPKQKHIINWKKAHTQRTSSINLKLSLSPSSLVAGEVACPYSKQFVHSKSSQYRKMKQEWRNNVYLARSKIQGLGLYAARDLEKHTMVIEYIGQVIRTEVSELREKQYDLRNRGIYMFRLDEERVVDATLSGGLARYINHSCNPNCVTEIVDVDREYRIIIFAKRRINKGEELSYDYKFDIEDDAHKISCMCDAPNCRKWMN